MSRLVSLGDVGFRCHVEYAVARSVPASDASFSRVCLAIRNPVDRFASLPGRVPRSRASGPGVEGAGPSVQNGTAQSDSEEVPSPEGSPRRWTSERARERRAPAIPVSPTKEGGLGRRSPGPRRTSIRSRVSPEGDCAAPRPVRPVPAHCCGRCRPPDRPARGRSALPGRAAAGVRPGAGRSRRG